MPWHKVRVYYDHHADHKRRVTYRLDVSILLVGALMVVTALLAMYPMLEGAQPASSRNDGFVQWNAKADPAPSIAPSQELLGGVAVLCLAYLAVAVFVRSKP
jgi:hypothetical protein